MTVSLDARKGVKLLDSWKDREGHFAKVFLADDERNGNGWRVTWPSIEKNHQDFIGFPGIEYHVCTSRGCDLDHIVRKVYQTALKAQEPFRVSDIVDTGLDTPTRTAYAVHEFTQDYYDRVISKNEEIYVSPAMWPKNGNVEIMGITMEGIPKLDIHDWSPVHVAFVNKPAYGKDKARIYSKCTGMGGECAIQMNAAVKTSHPMLIDHNGKMTYHTMPDDVDSRIQNATTDEERETIASEYYTELLNNGKKEVDAMDCEMTASLNQLEARMHLVDLERRIMQVSAAEEKSKDKPDVDERGAKCRWVTTRGRKFQICSETKEKSIDKSPESERKQEKK